MGALLSLPLLAVPSMGTVRILPGAYRLYATDGHLSYSLSAPHAAAQLRVLRFAVYVGSSRAGASLYP
jgi:hypothetical protein